MDFKIQYGKFENLPIEGEIGTVYYTTDTHQLFVCLLDTKVLEEIKVSEAEQATELYYLNDDGEKILLTPEEITSIGTILLQNVKNNQLIIGNEEGELISLEGLNTEEGLISSILEIDADGMIQQHSVLPPRLGGTGLNVQTQTAEAVIKELLKKAESGDIKQLIDNAGNGSNRITYTTATDSINDETITLKQYYGFDEGVTYKIKLTADLPANAAIAESNASNAKKYPIVDLKGNAMRGGEAIKDSYIELTYSDGKFFFKGGGGERPRKLKGFVEFTEDGTFCPADYGLQAGDEIKIILVAGGGASGYWKKDSDHQCPVAQEKFHGDPSYFGDLVAEGINFAGQACVAQTNGYTSKTLVISGAGGAGGYYPNFTPSAGRSISYSNYSSYASIPIEADDIDDVVNYYYYSPWEKNTTGGGCWAARPLATSRTKIKAPQILPNFIPQAENGTFKDSFPNYIAGFGGYGYGAGAGASYIDQSTNGRITQSGSSGKIIETTIQLNSLDEIAIKIGKGRTKEDIQTLNSTVKSVNSGTDGYCSVSWDIDETI